jgi:hypothetical protein
MKERGPRRRRWHAIPSRRRHEDERLRRVGEQRETARRIGGGHTQAVGHRDVPDAGTGSGHPTCDPDRRSSTQRRREPDVRIAQEEIGEGQRRGADGGALNEGTSIHMVDPLMEAWRRR